MADLSLLGLLKDAVGLFKGFHAGREKNASERLRFHRDVYEKFLLIHADYLRIFQWAESALLPAAVRPQDHPETVIKVRAYFGRERLDFAGERTHLRSLVAGLLSDVESEAERRFLWSMLSYFLEYEEPIKTLDKLDQEVRSILESSSSGGSTIATPSAFLLEQYENSEDPKALHALTKRTIEALAGRSSSIGVAYAALQLDLKRRGAS